MPNVNRRALASPDRPGHNGTVSLATLPPPPPAADAGAEALASSVLALADIRGPEWRASVMDHLRAALATDRAAARAALEGGGSGRACARALARSMDRTIAALHAVVARQHGEAGALTLVATGGYGRGTLAPGSDVDLLILLPQGAASRHAGAEAILYGLWDLGLKVGHATRNVEETLAEAARDLTTRTAILEARHLSGPCEPFDTLMRRFDSEILAGNGAAYAQAKLEERDQRLNRAGASRYLVEPHVKEGKGGLRDLNTLFWIARSIYRVREPEELVAAGLFTKAELALFQRCEDFLWAVRCMMHFLAGRAEERLTFDLQRPLAEIFRYRAARGLSPVERFMKHYFHVAKQVGDLTAIVCAALEAQERKPRAMLDRMVGAVTRRRRNLPENRDFIADRGRLTVADDHVFARDPVNLLRIFALAARHDLELHPDATRLVTLNLRRVDAALRENREANRLFLEMLCDSRAPDRILRRMHEAGVLGRFILEFGRIQAMMQFSSYHHYTVDEHTLRAIGALAALARGHLAEDLPLSSALIGKIASRRALAVALFLHDIGKGRGEDHSVAGARLARELGPRLGLTEAETETAAWLVENHLLMSHTAQHRDIMDPRTIATFVARVQTLERLRLLLVLTVCDIRAVGPNTWTGWKGQLLRQLYHETEVVLAGGHSSTDRRARIANAQAALRSRLPELSDAAFASYAQRHSPAYWLKTETEQQLAHHRLLARRDAQGGGLVTETTTDPFRGMTAITVAAVDHPRLLAIITGACAAAGANIVEAQIFTTTDGLALDTMIIGRAFAEDADELRRAARVARHIEGAVKGEIRLPEVIASRRAGGGATAAFRVTPEVALDNGLSDRATVVEVTGLDRPGLLYELTTAIGMLNLNIQSARIVTFGEKAVDVFYVTDLTGSKVTAPPKQAALKRALMRVLTHGATAA